MRTETAPCKGIIKLYDRNTNAVVSSSCPALRVSISAVASSSTTIFHVIMPLCCALCNEVNKYVLLIHQLDQWSPSVAKAICKYKMPISGYPG